MPCELSHINRRAQSVGAHTLLLGRQAGREVVYSRQVGLLMVEKNSQPTVVIAGATDNQTPALVSAMLAEQGLKGGAVYASANNLPPVAQGWDGVKAVVIGASPSKLSSLQMQALRRWVLGGGRLWLQAARVPQVFCRRLLGRGWRAVVAGRTLSARLHFVATHLNHVVVLHRAVRMVELIPNGMHTLMTVNGWPAVLQERFGRGRVLVCSLDGDGLLNANGKASDVLWPALQRFYHERSRLVQHHQSVAAAMKQFARAQIGYRVMRRRTVAVILGLFCVGLLVAGVWLHRRNRLEKIVWLAGGGAVGVAALLVVLGLAQRQGVPATVSTVGFFQATGEDHAVIAHVAIAALSPHSRPAAIRSSVGGMLTMDMTGQRHNVTRLIWTDYNQWHSRGLMLPSGSLLGGQYRGILAVKVPQRVSAVYGPDGLELTWPRTAAALSNRVIVGPSGALRTVRKSPSLLAVGPGQILPSGQFVVTAVLSQQDRWRSDVLRALTRHEHYARPTLLAWSSRVASPIRLAGLDRNLSQSLVELPLRIHHTPANTNVVVPWPLLHYTLAAGPGQRSPALVFDQRNHKWIGHLSMPADVFVRFQLPRQILPIRLTSVNVTLDIVASGRPVRLALFSEGKPAVVIRRVGVVGRMALHGGAGQVAPDAGGGVWVQIRVGGGLDIAHAWGIKTVRLSVAGRTLQSN
ncbi:MAG: hypothetical protein HKL96_12765 [Phycisphaerales bacterium]|nr:hypothetical protein [Phycisphaerales bacterium]